MSEGCIHVIKTTVPITVPTDIRQMLYEWRALVHSDWVNTRCVCKMSAPKTTTQKSNTKNRRGLQSRPPHTGTVYKQWHTSPRKSHARPPHAACVIWPIKPLPNECASASGRARVRACVRACERTAVIFKPFGAAPALMPTNIFQL